MQCSPDPSYWLNIFAAFVKKETHCFLVSLHTGASALILSNPRAKHQRPRLKVHGCWAYGFTVNTYILDEPSRHDSSAVIEMISSTIEDEPLNNLSTFCF